ncbi:SRP40-C domain-containing protein [Mycena indigotica]|uniref:SRP40-C domain-containing protein n=1 Tax=Mycena indigotica TaxID=2126181 RepID=A0A8H6VZ37_9AGAR|nr:SRP40-C domain-containing protein [Mycena indigotica]KAF7295578.1 SRP40-C domain-containing protein [Mycena indigotica]
MEAGNLASTSCPPLGSACGSFRLKTATYTLIHAFLTKHSHPKAAAALKKAAKEVVVLKDNIDVDGPQLDEIIREWKTMKDALPNSSSDSSSESDSDSSSESSDSSAPVTKSKKAAKSNKTAAKSSSSSSSDSSSDSSHPVTKKQTTKKASKSSSSSSDSSSDSSDSDEDASPSTAKPTPSSSSSSSSSDSSDSDSDSNAKPKASVKAAPKAKTATSTSSSSSEDSGSESDDESSDTDIPQRKKTSERASSRTLSTASSSPKVKAKKPSVSSSDSSEAEESDPFVVPPTKAKKLLPVSVPAVTKENVQVTKKRRTTEAGDAVATAVAVAEEVGNSANANKRGSNGKQQRKNNTPFQRINPDKVRTEYMMDNRYQNKAGPSNDYGKRAHEDLIVTRGAGFRKEKNKKKRGSYRGGEITMQSHSIKFGDDD